jgi:hypothetical protein
MQLLRKSKLTQKKIPLAKYWSAKIFIDRKSIAGEGNNMTRQPLISSFDDNF